MLPQMIAGHATAAGTRRYHARHAARVAPDHVRRGPDDLALSSVGIGTYLGAIDDERDAGYDAAIRRALAVGIDVVDTASNYRAQRSERVIGRVLASGVIARDEVFVASKAGFLPFDGSEPPDRAAYVKATFIDSGRVARADIVAGCHCIAPRYLAEQLAQSRTNLGLATLDCYYVHNPETQLDEVDRAWFRERMRAAFEALEAAVDAGSIRRYGIATWHGLREPPSSRHHLDLVELFEIAREVAGDRHHFACVQLPINPAMPEAFTAPTQRGMTVIDAARSLGLYVMSSASILQGRIVEALTAVRTLPGLGTALVGMSRASHVDANAATFRH